MNNLAIIIYRDPMSQWMWESGYAYWLIIGSCVGVTLIIVAALLDRLAVRCGGWSNLIWNRYAVGASLLVIWAALTYADYHGGWSLRLWTFGIVVTILLAWIGTFIWSLWLTGREIDERNQEDKTHE